MPLPKQPTKRGDLLSDYGPEVTDVPAAPKKAVATKKKTLKSQTSEGVTTATTILTSAGANTAEPVEIIEAATTKKTTKTTKRATRKTSSTKTDAKVAKPQRTRKTVPSEATANVSVETPNKAAVEVSTIANEVVTHKEDTKTTLRRGRAATPSNKRKLFVLDTNVLIHDPLSIFRFAEHDVFLPMTVLEELDNHKKGTSDVARNARSVSGNLDQLMELHGTELSAGVPLHLLGNNEATGHLFFETRTITAPIPDALPTFKGDNRILAVVKGVEAAFPDLAVVLVSKDINMRIKATMLGLPAEDYFNDKTIADTDLLYTGRTTVPSDFWSREAKDLTSWTLDGRTWYSLRSPLALETSVNSFIATEDGSFITQVKSIKGDSLTLATLRDYQQPKNAVWGVHARNMEQSMALNLLMDPEIDFVTLLGQAGTGKTLLTLAAALSQTLDERRFTEIIFTRATVSVGEEIGYLPGTEEEKMIPWMGALEDNLEVLNKSNSTGGEWSRNAAVDLIRSRIRVKSMSFMRGRTFLNKFVIIDEAQNLSPKQMKTLISRAGPGTKIVCMGNIAQIDTPYLSEGSSGLTYVVDRFRGWAHAGHITLQRGERSRLADHANEVL